MRLTRLSFGESARETGRALDEQDDHRRHDDEHDGDGGDERIGAAIILRSLEEPIRHIAANSGHDGGVIADEVKSHEGSVGFNANSGEVVDMFKAGIVDPTKVTRSALQNASSISGLMLTTEAMITNIKDDEKESAARIEGSVR